MHAISAAGVMYTLTRNCSLGDLDNCGCDTSRNGKMGKNILFLGACDALQYTVMFTTDSRVNTLCLAVTTGGRGWLWGGCSDNGEFGERISKQYVDALETGQDSRAAVNLHNNEAGRLVGFTHRQGSTRAHTFFYPANIVFTAWMHDIVAYRTCNLFNHKLTIFFLF